MKNLISAVSFCLLFLSICTAQNGKKSNDFIIMSYNTENFFDTINDPHTSDDEYTPDSKKHWDTERYKHKVQGIARVISEIAPGHFPDLVLLCEVENHEVLLDLIHSKEIISAGYQIIFEKGHDTRGISIGLLYRKKTFRLLSKKLIGIEYPGEKKESTRGILYVKGIVMKDDTIHIFGNHWKSRVGNPSETESKRIYDAVILKSKTDSLLRLNRNAKIICMGDFNDEPESTSINKELGASCKSGEREDEKLVDIMCPLSLEGKGSYSYRGRWQMLDNIILSKSLLSKKNRLHLNDEGGKIFGPSWLLKDNDKAGGPVPWKTYAGDKYLGGYSDHLPVYAELVKIGKRGKYGF